MRLVVSCVVILLFAVCVYCSHNNVGSGTDAKNLHKKLFVTDEYNNKVKPKQNQTDLVYVYMSLSILSINDLSEVTQTLKSTCYLSVTWLDEFLVWNVSDYSMSYFFTHQNDVWKPDIALKNSFHDYKELGTETMNLEVTSSGWVTWYPFQIFESMCSVDVHYYPFDTQTCELKFLAWSFTINDLIMTGWDDGIYLDDYEENPGWSIVDTSYTVANESSVSTMIFSIQMKRKPMFIILSVIMPITMLAILNIFVFVLPCDSGEKSGYAMTVFLAFAVFLTIVSSTLPDSSESVAVFSVFLIILTIQSTMITLIALVMIRCNLFDDEIIPVPSCIQSFLRLLSFETCLQKFRRGAVTPIAHDEKRGMVTVVQIEGTHEHHMDNREMTNDDRISDDRRSLGEFSQSSQRQYTWKETVNKFDVICFVFFTSVLILTVIVCGSVAATG